MATPPPIANEPVVSVSTITGIVSAAIVLLVAFGLKLNPQQVGAITAFVGLVAPLAVAAIVRHQVTANKNVAARITQTGSVVAGPAADQIDGTSVDVTSAVPGDVEPPADPGPPKHSDDTRPGTED